MKRTKERFGKLESYTDDGVSGLKVFDGEDLEYQDRVRLQQLQQKNWIEQQKYEKSQRECNDREENQMFAEQTLSINRMRAMLEGEHDKKRRDMNKMQMENYFFISLIQVILKIINDQLVFLKLIRIFCYHFQLYHRCKP